MNPETKQKLLLGCVAVLILVIGGISMFYPKTSEGFKKCICSQRMDQRVCQDTEDVEREYDSGQLTENTARPARGWTTTSPGDINYPTSAGCPWPDVENDGGWRKWDFTDFGSD